VIADGFPDVTVLFADAVDFTRRSERIAPSRWSRCSTTSFGNAYMVVGGLPEPRPDHAEAVAEMAWRCWRKEVAGRSDLSSQPLQVRIGIDTGPVVAGVIGISRFSYDLWATPSTWPAAWSPTGSLAASR
jgi:adenylate cyclase